MFTFTPLLGAQSSSRAVQSLLELDGGIKILADVGWDERFEAETLKALEKQAPTIALVLLTHATLPHIGAYAHCCKHIPLFKRIPVYATTPVISLGQTLLQDLYASNPLACSIIPQSTLDDAGVSYLTTPGRGASHILFPTPTADEIADYFASIIPLKYSQPHQPPSPAFAPSLSGLTITAYRAGHTLGGTLWHIQYGSESIVYAVDWNQARENVLSGAAWLGSADGNQVLEQLKRPTALVCSARNSELETVGGGWTRRDDILLTHIRDAIASGSSILIPSDSSARSLELMYLLERAWTDDQHDALRKARLYFASRSAGSTIRHARAMGEWMDEGLKQEFEQVRERADARDASIGIVATARKRAELPFDLTYLRVIERDSQLQRALQADGPAVFLASDESLDWGFSRQLAERLSARGQSLVLLTSAPAQTSSGIAQTLLQAHPDLRDDNRSNLKAIKLNISLRYCQTTPLETNDLTAYQTYLANLKEREDAGGPRAAGDRSSGLDANADGAEEDNESSSSSEDEDEQDGGDDSTHYQGKILNVSAAMTQSKHRLALTDEEMGVSILLRRKNMHDYDVRGKKGREKVFPFSVKRRRNDEFGEVIKPEDFLRAEEKEGAVAEATAAAAAAAAAAAVEVKLAHDDIGAKRRWDDQLEGGLVGAKKQRQSREGAEGADGGDSDESDYEPVDSSLHGPRKIEFESQDLALDFMAGFVDYCAIHDRRALQILLPLINPRKLVLTGGTQHETEALAEECRRIFAQTSTSEGGTDVFTPHNGAVVDASVDTNAWTIKLTQGLYKKLHWQMIDANNGIVTVNGQVEAAALPETERDTNTAKKQRLDAGGAAADASSEDGERLLPLLGELPASLAAATRAAQMLHVGDMKLPELRRLLQSKGLLAEFRGEGTLLVDGYIVVRKSGLGKIEVESIAPAEANARISRQSFHNVRAHIYKSLAIVSAR